MKIFGCLFALLVCMNPVLFADASSTNYALVEDRFTGGGGSSSSTNYAIAETSFDTFAGGTFTSTNYGVNSKVGIAGAAPIASITSISPVAFSKHYSDESPAFTVTAIDPDSDTLDYQVRQDGTIKDGPQNSNSLTWALSGSDIGRHTLSFEVIDPDGTVKKQQAAYVFRRPTK